MVLDLRLDGGLCALGSVPALVSLCRRVSQKPVAVC